MAMTNPYPKTESFQTENVTELPDQPQQGILYIYERYPLTLHLCACGCGAKLAISLLDWQMIIEDDGSVTFNAPFRSPSCQAQYSIIKGKVIWL